MELSNVSFLSNNATNCITQVPQDIKLELSSGTLTLKAGSKVYVPNGFEENGTTTKFDEVILNTDKTLTYSSTGTYFIFFEKNSANLRQFGVSQCFSGSTAPSGQTYMMWFDTTNNLIKVSENSGSTWTAGYSFPLAIVQDNTSIKTIFNGSGYIGKHIFVLPGLKGLCPDGFDENGYSKNREIEITKVSTVMLDPAWGTSMSGHKFFARFTPTYSDCQPDTRFTYSTPTSGFTGNYFNKVKNIWEWWDSGVFQANFYMLIASNYLATITASDASISNFNPPKVYQAESKEDFTEDYSLAETYTGKHWIDGKKIWRKVYTGTTASSSPGSVSQPLNITNLDKIIRSSFELYDSSGGTVNTYYSSSDNYAMYFISGASLLYVAHAYSNRDSRPYVVILEYTKTTD